MTKIFNLNQIKMALEKVDLIDLIKSIEDGFVAYSQDKVVVPPIGEMIFEKPPGDVHIKYGYIKEDEYYVIKIASGFYDNIKLNLPSSNGLMLVFNQQTGELASILLDEGYLTDIRTAAAGALAAKYLAPKDVKCIGIFGAGTQGKLQLEYLKSITSCRDAIVWGLNENELSKYKEEMEVKGFQIKTTLDSKEVTSNCNLIVTATPSKLFLIDVSQINEGTHITAMGSDTTEKNELDPKILQKADIVVADSISQCLNRGEIYKALKAKVILEKDIVELGNVIQNKKLQRQNDGQITIADLTGVAVQDIQIATTVFKILNK